MSGKKETVIIYYYRLEFMILVTHGNKNYCWKYTILQCSNPKVINASSLSAWRSTPNWRCRRGSIEWTARTPLAGPTAVRGRGSSLQRRSRVSWGPNSTPSGTNSNWMLVSSVVPDIVQCLMVWYCINSLLHSSNYNYRIIKISFFKKEGIVDRIFYESRVYEFVEDESLS